MNTKTLTAGRKYDTDSLTFAGWSNGRDDIPGMSCWDYFRDGVYLGADADGIEPLFQSLSDSDRETQTLAD